MPMCSYSAYGTKRLEEKEENEEEEKEENGSS